MGLPQALHSVLSADAACISLFGCQSTGGDSSHGQAGMGERVNVDIWLAFIAEAIACLVDGSSSIYREGSFSAVCSWRGL